MFERRTIEQRQNGDAKSNDTKYSKSKNECNCCGNWNHSTDSCKYRTYICNACNKKGHLAHVCRSKPQQHRQHHFIEEKEEEEDDDGENCKYQHVSLYKIQKLEVKENEPILIDVKLNNVYLQMELDSGAGVSVISKQCFDVNFKQSSKLMPSKTRLRGYGGEPLRVIGMFR